MLRGGLPRLSIEAESPRPSRRGLRRLAVKAGKPQPNSVGVLDKRLVGDYQGRTRRVRLDSFPSYASIRNSFCEV